MMALRIARLRAAYGLSPAMAAALAVLIYGGDQ
jgi:hypothetical protein